MGKLDGIPIIIFFICSIILGGLLRVKQLRIPIAIIYFGTFIVYPVWSEKITPVPPIIRVPYFIGIIALYVWNVPVLTEMAEDILKIHNPEKENLSKEDSDKKYLKMFLIIFLDLFFFLSVVWYFSH
ncbi:MAG: hypothetical protein J6Z11_05940 [Candidatus Riflebacteria bacterium]|nr:hypothetical protein [Candidatus Riflebacteria bacterium]